MWISLTARGVSRRCNRVIAPPNKSALLSHGDRGICLSAWPLLSLIPPGLLGPRQLPLRSGVWRMFVQVASTPSSDLPLFYSVHPASPPSSLLTFDPPLPGPPCLFWKEKMIVWRREAKGRGLSSWAFHIWSSERNHLSLNCFQELFLSETNAQTLLKARHASPLGTRLLITRCGVFCALSQLSWQPSFDTWHTEHGRKPVKKRCALCRETEI